MRSWENIWALAVCAGFVFFTQHIMMETTTVEAGQGLMTLIGMFAAAGFIGILNGGMDMSSKAPTDLFQLLTMMVGGAVISTATYMTCLWDASHGTAYGPAFIWTVRSVMVSVLLWVFMTTLIERRRSAQHRQVA